MYSMNLEELFQLIKDNIKLDENINIKHLYQILNNYNGTDWITYRTVDETKYNKQFVYGTDEFDMYIITWNKYQQSKIHNHPENGCIYKILEGHMVEEFYDKHIRLSGFNSSFKDRIGYIHDSKCLHKMINYHDKVAVSLHIYSPSNHNTTYYNEPANSLTQ